MNQFLRTALALAVTVSPFVCAAFAAGPGNMVVERESEKQFSEVPIRKNSDYA